MVPQLRPSELAVWLASASASKPAQQPVVLDVREPWEWQTASVPERGFALQRIPMGEIGRRLDELPAGSPIACLCHHGGRSQRVAEFLQQQGHGPVVNIAGGIDAWSLELDSSVPRY